MNLFSGTPNEAIWPGITSLPDYKECFPNFESKGFSDLSVPVELHSLLQVRFFDSGPKRTDIVCSDWPFSIFPNATKFCTVIVDRKIKTIRTYVNSSQFIIGGTDCGNVSLRTILFRVLQTEKKLGFWDIPTTDPSNSKPCYHT